MQHFYNYNEGNWGVLKILTRRRNIRSELISSVNHFYYL